MAIRQLAIVIAALDAADAFSTIPPMVGGRAIDPDFVLPETGCTCDTLDYINVDSYRKPTWASCSITNQQIANDVIDDVCNDAVSPSTRRILHAALCPVSTQLEGYVCPLLLLCDSIFST